MRIANCCSGRPLGGAMRALPSRRVSQSETATAERRNRAVIFDFFLYD
jgi:hypothetical protein